MKRFLRYMFVITAILMVVVGDVWAESLQYTWVERFNGTTTFDNDDLQKITNGEYTNNVKFSISGVSWYNTLGVKRLDYPDQKDGNVHSSKWEWSTQSNDNNPYNVKVTKVQAAVRGYCNDGCDWANARFNNNDWISCGTKDLGEGGSKDVSIENTQGLDSYVTLYTQNYYRESSWSNWVEDYATFTLHNIRYTYKVTQRMPLFQYKAVAVAEPNTGGDVYASWVEGSFFASEAVATSYDAQIYDVSTGMTKTVYFKAVAKEGYNFVGWKRNPSDAQYVSTSAIYTENLTSKSNDADAPATITMYAVFMPKNQPLFTGNDISGVKVGESVITNFVFEHVGDKKPTANENDDFYYVIQHYPDASSKADSPNPNLVVSYNPNTNQIIGLNSGTAKITFIHKDNDDYYYAESEAYEIAVIKHQPEFKWHGQAANVNTIEYFNNQYADFFVSSSSINNASLKLTYSSSDEDVATLSTGSNAQKLNLTTYNKETSTTLTVTQAENYYWYGKTETKAVTPIDPNNHVPFVIDSSDEMWNVFYSSHNKDLSWDNGLKFSNNDDLGFDWEDNYLIIRFTGVPDKLFFTTSIQDGATGVNFTVSEGVDDSNLKEIYNKTFTESNVTLQLSPSTRFLKLCYSGNLNGYFKGTDGYAGIRVTELEEFHAVNEDDETIEVEYLDFEANQVFTDKTLSFNLKYANAGYKVKVESNDSRFTVNPTSINTIGGCKYGKENISVTYRSTTPYETTDNSYIVISDELAELNGHRDTVYLRASSYQPTQQLEWRADFKAVDKPTVRVKDGEITNAAIASSGLPVTYTSSDTTVIAVRNEGTVLLPKAAGEVTITALQEGNETWQPVGPITKNFIVTDKIIQYIVWSDDLTDLVVGGDNVNLTAKVYLQNEETKQWEENSELTEKLVYTIDNTSVVSVAGNVLSIHSIGQTTATVTAPGNTDYAVATLTKPVRVRSAAAGCEDVLLLNHRDEVRFFAYNLDQIVQGEFAIDHTKGVPGTLSFQHSGASWDLGIQYYAGTIRAEYNTTDDSNWVLAKEVTPTEDQTNLEFDIPLPRNASKIRFVRPAGGQGYHYVSNIQVHPAQYIEAVETIDLGEIHVGSIEDTTFVVNYANIKDDVYLTASSGTVTTNPTSFGEQCGEFGTKTITVQWIPSEVNANAQETVTLTDGVSGTTCVVKLIANVTPGTQNLYWQDRPTVISNCGDIEFPEQTTAHIDIIWEVVSGQDVAGFNNEGELVLYKQGEITIRGYNAGNANYHPFAITYTFTINYDPVFLGTVDTDWNNVDNWNICRLPNENDIVTIKALVELVTHEKVKGMKFAENGKMHIAHNAGMTIGSHGLELTTNGLITIDNTPNGAGFLKVDPLAANKPTNKVKINYTTCAYDSGSQRNEIWQYMGAPGTDMQMSDASYTMIYHWNEQEGWLKLSNTELTPFYGYAFTQSKAQEATFEISAKPIIPTVPQEISLTCTPAGMGGSNVFVNSFLAPIDLNKFENEDFVGNVDKAFYLFNSGSWNQWQQNGGSSNTMQYGVSPGQYYALSPYGSSLMDPTYDQTTIPPMQGVYVIARENGAKIKLDYAKHVYAADASNAAMRIPQHQDDFKRIRLYVYGANSGADRMYLIQHNQCTSGYDNGYDAINMPTEGQVSIYSNEAAGQMEISITDRIDSSYIGFRAGMDSEYVLRMTSVLGEQLYLYDLQENTVVPIVDGTEYAFTATPNSVNDRRFLVTDKTSKSDVSDTEDVDVYIYDKKAYVKQAPLNSVMTVYTIGGLSMASYSVGNTPCVVDLSILPVGVYVLKVANKAYKFVCE